MCTGNFNCFLRAHIQYIYVCYCTAYLCKFNMFYCLNNTCIVSSTRYIYMYRDVDITD